MTYVWHIVTWHNSSGLIVKNDRLYYFYEKYKAPKINPNQLPGDVDPIALPWSVVWSMVGVLLLIAALLVAAGTWKLRQKYLTIFYPEPEYIDNVIAPVNISDLPDVTMAAPATPNPALKQSACADCIEEPYVVNSPSIGSPTCEPIYEDLDTCGNV